MRYLKNDDLYLTRGKDAIFFLIIHANVLILFIVFSLIPSNKIMQNIPCFLKSSPVWRVILAR